MRHKSIHNFLTNWTFKVEADNSRELQLIVESYSPVVQYKHFVGVGHHPNGLGLNTNPKRQYLTMWE